MTVYQDLSQFKLPRGFRGRSGVVVQLWWFTQATVFRHSPQVLYGWRRWLLRIFGASIGKDVVIRPTAKITYPWKVIVGKNTWIGDNVELYSLAEIRIGANAVVSQGSYLCTGAHNTNSESFDIYALPITVEDEAWICAGVFIHPGVKIGFGSVVAARSVVTMSTEQGMIYAGSPARLQKPRLAAKREYTSL